MLLSGFSNCYVSNGSDLTAGTVVVMVTATVATTAFDSIFFTQNNSPKWHKTKHSHQNEKEDRAQKKQQRWNIKRKKTLYAHTHTCKCILKSRHILDRSISILHLYWWCGTFVCTVEPIIDAEDATNETVQMNFSNIFLNITPNSRQNNTTKLSEWRKDEKKKHAHTQQIRQLNPPPFWHIAFLFAFICIWWLHIQNDIFVQSCLFLLSFTRFGGYYWRIFVQFFFYFHSFDYRREKANRIKQKIHMCFRSFTRFLFSFFSYWKEDVNTIFRFHVCKTQIHW